jgi:hypothetical protein
MQNKTASSKSVTFSGQFFKRRSRKQIQDQRELLKGPAGNLGKKKYLVQRKSKRGSMPPSSFLTPDIPRLPMLA